MRKYIYTYSAINKEENIKNKTILCILIVLIIALSINNVYAKNPYGYNYGNKYGINAFSEEIASKLNRVISYMSNDGYYYPIDIVHDDVENNTCYLYGYNGISCIYDVDLKKE